MKLSEYKSYDELPLFLNAAMAAKVLGAAPSSAYELLHEKDFPVLKIGNRLAVPKEKFTQWAEQHTQGVLANEETPPPVRLAPTRPPPLFPLPNSQRSVGIQAQAD